MFILVKYGNNETLLCNPSCAVVNLLTSIKRRAGYGSSNVIVDIADETGKEKVSLHKFYFGCDESFVAFLKRPIRVHV